MRRARARARAALAAFFWALQALLYMSLFSVCVLFPGEVVVCSEVGLAVAMGSYVTAPLGTWSLVQRARARPGPSALCCVEAAGAGEGLSVWWRPWKEVRSWHFGIGTPRAF